MSRVLALGSDLYFVPQIQSAAEAAGFSFAWLDSYRPTQELLADLRADPPALIVLDLNTSLPWPEWLPAAKADPALAAVPWLVFGSHMNPRRLAAARHAGADRVVPKSQFAAALQEELSQNLSF
jgi:hypothetical protein